MLTLFTFLLYVHIAGGSAGLLFSVMAMAVAKGGRWHKLWGKIFAYGMVGAGVSSLGLSILHPNPFLGAIGVFSLYLSLTGLRALAWRGLAKAGPGWQDAALQATMAVGGLCMLGIAAYYIARTPNGQMGIVLGVFGTIGLLQAAADYRIVYKAQRQALFWLRAHIQKMLGATIAAYTAFLVVNGDNWPDVPGLLLWLGPTVVGSVLIGYWMRRVAKGTALARR